VLDRVKGRVLAVLAMLAPIEGRCAWLRAAALPALPKGGAGRPCPVLCALSGRRASRSATRLRRVEQRAPLLSCLSGSPFGQLRRQDGGSGPLVVSRSQASCWPSDAMEGR